MTCPFEVNDGAYILGALAPADRAEFENHLASCPTCRASVAALAVLPGLLGRLDPRTVQPLAPVPAEVLTRVLAAIRARRRSQRRLLTVAAALVATAAMAASVGVGLQVYGPLSGGNPAATEPADDLVLTPAVPKGSGSVTAEMGIEEYEIGTVVEVRCRYTGQNPDGWPVWLVVFTRTGDEPEAIGSWVVKPGVEVQATAATHVPAADIERIELQREGHEAVVVWTP